VVLVANLSALLVPPPGLWPFRILAGAAAGMAVGAGNAIIARSIDPDRLYGLSATLATAFSAMARYTKITVNPDAVDRCFVHLFGPGHPTAPAEITRDLDATDDPVHGVQEGRFVQGYYGHYCCLPLHICAGEHLLCARLQPGGVDASAGATDELARNMRLTAAVGAALHRVQQLRRATDALATPRSSMSAATITRCSRRTRGPPHDRPRQRPSVCTGETFRLRPRRESPLNVAKGSVLHVA